jgi:hypothetical protein
MKTDLSPIEYLQKRVKYYEELYTLVKAKSDERYNAEMSFRESLKDLNVKWYNKNNSGMIERNGLRFEFDITPTHIEKKIAIEYLEGDKLQNFLKLADNQYREVK